MLSERICGLVDKYPVITFDLYDTLVHRNVKKPEDVFELVGCRYNRSRSAYEKRGDFPQERIKAYRKAYEKYKAKCTLDAIYDEIEVFSESEKEELKKTELEIEQNICTVNLPIREILDYAIKKGKITAIVSDMYLPADVIETVLKNCGIFGYDRLFVSCEYGASKTDGGLFSVCADFYNVSPKEILHFGDGIKNDYIRALQTGVHPVHVRNNTALDYDDDSRLSRAGKIQYSVQQAFIRNNLSGISDPAEKLGFEVLAPLVYGFCTWLHRAIHKQQIEKVFFLAREGKILKTVYEMMFPDEDIPLNYLYVSRKSLVIPAYWIKPEYESVVNSLAKTKELTASALLSRWGLEADSCRKELEAVGLHEPDIIDGRSLLLNSQVRALFELLQSRIVDSSRQKYELLKKYLMQEGFDGKTAIVDIGWNGGMQNALSKIVSVWNTKTEIFGYYFGINSANLGIELKNAHGFVYEGERSRDNRYYIYSFAGPLEFALTAEHETTSGYLERNGKIEPEFESSGREKYDGVREKQCAFISAVQNGIKKYIRIFICQKPKELDFSESEAAFRNCRLFGLMPKTKHIKMLQPFDANDFGVEQHFVDPKYRHIFGKNNIIKGFWRSTWKSGYLKMIFGLPLPYYRIYLYARKKIN